jgi:hypothetical protein
MRKSNERAITKIFKSNKSFISTNLVSLSHVLKVFEMHIGRDQTWQNSRLIQLFIEAAQLDSVVCYARIYVYRFLKCS